MMKSMRHQDVKLENGVTVETWVPSWKVVLRANGATVIAVVMSVVTMAAARAVVRRHAVR